MSRNSYSHFVYLFCLVLLSAFSIYFAWPNPSGALAAQIEAGTIPAIKARTPDGAQFVVYADSCSGKPGTVQERNLAAVNRIVQSFDPQPEFIVFPGDNIAGDVESIEGHRKQWRYFLDKEMAWLSGRNSPFYPTTSNHNTFGPETEAIFREVFPDLPKNGPKGQEGLSYWVRRGPLLLVAVNTNYSGLTDDRYKKTDKYYYFGSHGHIECKWLDEVLTQNADARYKFVAGHVPAFPFNGYGAHAGWVLDPKDAKPFWDVLVKHKVQAYLASHVLVFDAQVRSGVLQITTGGAGTGVMGRNEYLHAVQVAVDREGLRWQARDIAGTIREWLSWPIPNTTPAITYYPLAADKINDALKSAFGYFEKEPGDQWFTSWRFSGVAPAPADHPQSLLTGSSSLAILRIMFDGNPPRLIVELQTQANHSSDRWLGPRFEQGKPFSFELALHNGMGPGGVLYRPNAETSWNSLDTESAKGCEDMVWPAVWVAGRGHYGPTHDVYKGDPVKIEWSGLRALPRSELFK